MGQAKPKDETVDATAIEEPVQFKPAPAELVVRPNVPEDVFRAMDAHDELQILEQLEGRPSEVMVYSFEAGGKRQTGLSFAGVAEVVRTMNDGGFTKIKVSPDFAPVFEDVQEENEHGTLVTYVQATVYAVDEVNGGGLFGTARQAKFQVFRDKAKKPKLDAFARAKALSKAQRNAMLPLTPMVYRETLIAQQMQNKVRVKELRLGMGDPTAEMPPPLTDARALELVAEIRDAYKQARALDPMALPPGQFQSKLERARHEHAALEELLAFVVGLRVHLAEKAS